MTKDKVVSDSEGGKVKPSMQENLAKLQSVSTGKK
jgi:hypothetical protein